MGTLELHRTSIVLAAAALSTNRSMCAKELRRQPRQKSGRATEISKEPLWRIICFARNGLTGTPRHRSPDPGLRPLGHCYLLVINPDPGIVSTQSHRYKLFAVKDLISARPMSARPPSAEYAMTARVD